MHSSCSTGRFGAAAGFASCFFSFPPRYLSHKWLFSEKRDSAHTPLPHRQRLCQESLKTEGEIWGNPKDFPPRAIFWDSPLFPGRGVLSRLLEHSEAEM